MTLTKIFDRFKRKKSKDHVLKSGQSLGQSYITVENDTPGNHKSSFNVDLAYISSVKPRFKIFTDGTGGIIFGNNQRIKIVEDGLTSVRSYTLPDYDTKFMGNPTDTIIMGPSIITPLSNPNTNYSKIYIKQIDSHNDGVFALIKKNDTFIEVQML